MTLMFFGLSIHRSCGLVVFLEHHYRFGRQFLGIGQYGRWNDLWPSISRRYRASGQDFTTDWTFCVCWPVHSAGLAEGRSGYLSRNGSCQTVSLGS
ncbi:hypothetical protein BDR22DRAFT_842773 [Usnea florida]